MTVTRATATKSMLWSAVENGGLSFLSFVSLIVYSRILSPSDFGLFATVLALIELFQIISNMAFHDALVQRPQVSDLHFDTAFSVTIIISVSFTVLSWAIGPLFSVFMSNAKAGPVLSWLGLNFAFSGFSAVLTARQRREFGFRFLAMRSLAGRLAGAIFGIVAAFMGAGIWSLVIQQLLMNLLGSITLWLASENVPKLRFGVREFNDLILFGASAVTALFVNFGVKRLFVFFSGFFLGPVTAGFLNLAFRTIDTFWAVTATAISQVTLPMMSRLQNDPERLRRAYHLAVGLTCVLLYSMFVGLGMTAPEVVVILFGKKWLLAYPYITTLSFLVLSQAPRLFATPLLTAKGRPQDVLLAYGAGFVYIAIAIFLTRLRTPTIAVSVWVGAEIVYYAFFSVLLTRATGITFREQIGSLLAPLLATLAMVLCIIVLRLFIGNLGFAALRLALFAMAGGGVFIGSLYGLDRALFREMLGFVRSLAMRKQPQ